MALVSVTMGGGLTAYERIPQLLTCEWKKATSLNELVAFLVWLSPGAYLTSQRSPA